MANRIKWRGESSIWAFCCKHETVAWRGEMEGDINLNGNKMRNINPNLVHEDEVVPKQWIERLFK